MEEIKVGDYIRTEQWGIAKVAKVDKNGKCTHIKNKNNRLTHYFTQIGNTSPNILDLIEVGDVLEIQEKDGEIAYLGLKQDTTTMTYKALIEDIKNKEVKLLGIVTKEQFNSIKYVIGE